MKVWEIFICALMAVFGASLLLEPDIVKTDVYKAFADSQMIGWGMLAISVGISTCVFKTSSKAKHCSGFCMLLAAAVWSIISAQFIGGYPPFSMPMVIFPLVSIFCAVSGFINIKQGRTNGAIEP